MFRCLAQYLGLPELEVLALQRIDPDSSIARRTSPLAALDFDLLYTLVKRLWGGVNSLGNRGHGRTAGRIVALETKYHPRRVGANLR